MSVYGVTKTIEFCYGHRLLDYEGKCRNLHGHNGLLQVEIKSDSLDEQGMVMDFGDVNDVVKRWVDENLDHRMILWSRDPAVSVLTDLGEPLYLVDENPTAENIAKLIFDNMIVRGLSVSEIRLWETSSSYANYRRT